MTATPENMMIEEAKEQAASETEITTVDLDKRPFIFLAYSHKNEEVVRKIHKGLTARGFHCWIDYEHTTSTGFTPIIANAIHNCILFVAFLSEPYMVSKYVEMEFDAAMKGDWKSIMTVCLDQVTDESNPERRYVFSFFDGKESPGYGTGPGEDLDAFCDQIADSYYFQSVRRYYISKDKNDLPPIKRSKAVLSCLRTHLEKNLANRGEGFADKVKKELYPVLLDRESGKKYPVGEDGRTPLACYLERPNQKKGEHYFVTGEGGMGKTIGMMMTCDYLLKKDSFAVYVPLNMIGPETSLDKYLMEHVCANNRHIYDLLRLSTGNSPSENTSVYFFLDGLNEMTDEGSIKNLLVNEVLKRYIFNNRDVKFIISAREDLRSHYGIEQEFRLLELMYLGDTAIGNYLSANHIKTPTNPKLKEILRTPLLLSLYTQTENRSGETRAMSRLQMEAEPDSPGKILWNYFQMQMYLAEKNGRFKSAEIRTVLEYYLPAIAWEMVRQNSSLNTGYDVVAACARQVENKSLRFVWYRDYMLGRVLMDTRVEAQALRPLAVTNFHFLVESEGEFHFLHQSFRDFFAARYLFNEMMALAWFPVDEQPFPSESLGLESCLLPITILHYLADLTGESQAAPFYEKGTWSFPQSKLRTGKGRSLAEGLLERWRKIEGEAARTAVRNLIFTMRAGRERDLSNSDFRDLDMRSCELNGCRFTDWDQEKSYPSLFDGAWLDKNCFLSEGHLASVLAVCPGGKDKLFTADKGGVIRAYHMAEHRWLPMASPATGEPIYDLAWNEEAGALAVVCENDIYLCDASGTVIERIRNYSFGKQFRYAHFENDGRLVYSYNLDPLTWYDLDGRKTAASLREGMPSRCAAVCRNGSVRINSTFFRQLLVEVFDPESGEWQMHPGLVRKLEEVNLQRKARGENEWKHAYLSLRDYGVYKGSSITCICCHQVGERFLVTAGRFLMEFSLDSLSLLSIRAFSDSAYTACYVDGGIAVGVDGNVYLLNPDLSDREILRMTQVSPVMAVMQDPEGDGYYVLSKNRELKRLDSDLRVKQIRIAPSKGIFVWAYDRLTGETQMVFRENEGEDVGIRYSFATDSQSPLGWRYRFLDTRIEDEMKDERVIKAGNSIMTVQSVPPYKKIFYDNYSGIWIFDCSFKGIKGGLADPEGCKLVRQNGGLTDE